MKIKDIDVFKRFMILLIAPTGFGKTLTSGSFHKAGKMWIADFDWRLKILKLKLPADADIEYDQYGPHNFHEFTEKMRGLVKNNPYKTIMIDSITSLTVSSVTSQMIQKGASNKKTGGGMFVPSWDEWNGEAAAVTELLDICKILKCHVIWTAHPVNKLDMNNNTKFQSITSYGPKVTGMIPGYFDEIYHMRIDRGFTEKDPTKRLIITSSDIIETARTSLGIPKTLDVTDEGLYDALMKFLPKTEEKLQESFVVDKPKEF